MNTPEKLAKAGQRSRLDRLFFAIVTRGWSAAQITDYSARLRRHNEALPAQFTEAFALIDTKTTGVLTHVSLMIAGLGLVAPLVASSEFEISVVIMEIAVYLLIAIGCLRCLSIFRLPRSDDNSYMHLQWAEHELIIRRELYTLCVRASILFTLVVFLLLPVLFFYKPERAL